jgi:hypothetical protein
VRVYLISIRGRLEGIFVDSIRGRLGGVYVVDITERFGCVYINRQAWRCLQKPLSNSLSTSCIFHPPTHTSESVLPHSVLL